MERNAHMSKLEARVKELENKVELLIGMILGVTDRITDMDRVFATSIFEVAELVAQVRIKSDLPLGKKIPKASQCGSSVRSSTPNKKRQSTLRADSSRSSRKKG